MTQPIGFILTNQLSLYQGNKIIKVKVSNSNTQYVAGLLTMPLLSNGRVVIVVRWNSRIRQLQQVSVARIRQFQQICPEE
jgi:hypothetical protein